MTRRVVCPAVRAAVGGGEEFDEAAAGALAAGANMASSASIPARTSTSGGVIRRTVQSAASP